MLYRVAVDLKMDGMLFQLSVFHLFNKIFSDPAASAYKVGFQNPLLKLLIIIFYIFKTGFLLAGYFCVLPGKMYKYRLVKNVPVKMSGNNAHNKSL